MTDRIEADFLIETSKDPARAAEVMAGEQSSGTFVAVPGEDSSGVREARATVERVGPAGDADTPSMPGATPGRPRLARVTLSWPLSNLGPSLPNLQATVAGNLFEPRAFSGLKLLDLRLPRAFGEANPGPRFGVEGTRRLSGVAEGPLIGTIVKPSVGLSPDETADLVATLCEAGIDFVKDDELQADGPHCPFDARVRAVMAVIRAQRDRTGRAVMFAFNLTGEVDQMRARHDLVEAEGGTCVMASIHSLGLSGFLSLARHSRLPIHAHRNGWGMLGRHPNHGLSFVAWSKLWRLAGAGHLHYKACSTMDSGPQAGSLGRALELGLAATGEACAPILLAAPSMGRWRAFGALFASARGEVHRIDRHLVMARHPVTPMDEADVVRRLARQTALPLAALMRPWLGVEGFDRLAREGARGVALDCAGEDDLAAVGRIVAGRRVALGSQGVEMALIAFWRAEGWLPPAAPPPLPSRVAQVAVVSGCASATTARQIAEAEAAGWPVIRLDTGGLFGPDPDAPLRAALNDARAALARGASPIVAALRGPDDPALAATRTAIASAGLSPTEGEARIGAALGAILAHLDAPLPGGGGRGHLGPGRGRARPRRLRARRLDRPRRLGDARPPDRGAAGRDRPQGRPDGRGRPVRPVPRVIPSAPLLRLLPRGDVQAAEEVGGGDPGHQRRQPPLVVRGPRRRPDRVGHRVLAVGEPCHLLGQRRPLGRVEGARIVPVGDRAKPRVALAGAAGRGRRRCRGCKH